jgi:amino acid adenylation domain-containing protein
MLVESLCPQRSLGHTPLFQVMFVFQNDPTPNTHWPGLALRRFDVETRTAKFDLTISIEKKDGFEVALEYNTDLFEAATVQRMLDHYQRLLEAVASHPEIRLGNLPILTPNERRQVLVDWNPAQSSYPQACIHDLFEEQVEQAPEAVALTFQGRQISYHELNRRSNQLARYLQVYGIGPEVKVGICFERSPELVIGILGILKAGGAYVPLDPSDPLERLAFIVRDSGMQVLLTQREFSGSLATEGVRVIYLDSFLGWDTQDAYENVVSGATSGNLAYVMYTSGSTGQPKGVEILHRGIVSLLFGQDYVRLNEKEVFLQLAPISSDASTFEIWGPLLHGGRCVLFPGKIPTALELGEVLSKHQVTTLWLTASLFNALVEEAPEALLSVRQLLVGGEGLSIPHVRRAMKQLPHAELINAYSATESTTLSCTYRIPRETRRTPFPIPIGRPIAHTSVYILDHHMQPVPTGVQGELYIEGPGVARGYVDQPQFTHERFVPNPFGGSPQDRLCKTGDLARYLPDGNIEFLGRVDNQVKIRGFRIEPGEIEAALAQHPQVKAAAVAVREDPRKEKYLVAYAVPRDGKLLQADELGAFLKKRLPDYMVPAHFLVLSSLPLLSSGKIDRQALPTPEPLSRVQEREYVAPRNSIEAKLVKIWERTLGTKPIGVTDNFFDLGGHSLMAVRLVAVIQDSLGKKLDLPSLFSAPTIEQIAACLKNGGSRRASCLVRIQPKGSKPPLFCVYAGGGRVLPFCDLALELGPDQPLYGLRSPESNGRPLDARVESLADNYIRDIRQVQPQGPYYLAGASFGGLVAFEMANQLRAEGEEVALLAMLNTVNPAFFESLPVSESFQFRLRGYLGKVKYHTEGFIHARPQERRRLIVELGRWAERQIGLLPWRAVYAFCQRFGLPLPRPLRHNPEVFLFAGRRYRPKPYPGRLSLFKAKEQKAQFVPDPNLGWASLAQGGIEIYEVPGNHMTMLDKPRVARLAEQLRASLQAAHDGPLPLTEELHSNCA